MKEIGRVILEMLIVAAVGTGFALAANSIANLKSDSGLQIGTDYFAAVKSPAKPHAGSAVKTQPVTQPTVTRPSDGATPPVESDPSSQAGHVTEPDDPTTQLVKEKGFTPIKFDEVVKMYSDPKYQIDAYVFVDGRNEEQFKAGHIPRAWRLDHFHLQQTLDAVLPMIYSADKVVLYCTGGNCEDSLMLAGDLQQFGVDISKLHVYVGGIEEWAAKGQPVEKGERGSGEITTGGGQ